MSTGYRVSLPFLQSLFPSLISEPSYRNILVQTHPHHRVPTEGRLDIVGGWGDHQPMIVDLKCPQSPNPGLFYQEDTTYSVSQDMFELLIFDPVTRSWTADWSGLSQRPVKHGK
ncbi:MAG TPA: hypothetical protein VG734_07280 [Lacunisphaera sp.]|nr:hypothetical protein [Lacunisphaera sp.]